MIIRQSFTLLKLLILKQLRKLHIVALLIVVPVLIAVLFNSGILTKDTGNIIGIYVDDNGSNASEIAEYLINHDYEVTFKEYTNHNSMLNDIKNGRIDCAYEFPEDFSSKVLDKPNGSIILYVYDSESLLSAYSNEMIFEATLKTIADEMMLKYLDDSDYFSGASIHDKALEYFYSNRDTDEVFHISTYMLNEDNSTSKLADTSSSESINSLRYMVAIVIMLSALLGSIYRANSLNNSAFEVMNQHVKNISSLVYPIAYSLPIAISCSILLVAAKSSRGLIDIINLILLEIASVLLAALLANIIPNSRMLAGSIPIIIMISVCLFPIFFDFQTFAPWIIYIKRILPPYFINLL